MVEKGFRGRCNDYFSEFLMKFFFSFGKEGEEKWT